MCSGNKWSLLRGLGFLVIAVLLIFFVVTRSRYDGFVHFKSEADIVPLFPKSAEEIRDQVKKSLAALKKAIDELVALPAEKRSFETFIVPLDKIMALSHAVVLAKILFMLDFLSPDEAIRQEAHKGFLEISEFLLMHIEQNKKLYEVLRAYAEHNPESGHREYFVTELLAGFKRSGFDLPEDKFAHVMALKKELITLGQQFEANIAADTTMVAVALQDLKGVEADFLAAFKKNEQGEYLLDIKGPTYDYIMKYCSNDQVRKKFFLAYNNRAYPVNKEVLTTMIAKRDALALELGFTSYAHLDLDKNMVKKPEQAEHFLQDLLHTIQPRVDQEIKQLQEALPDSVKLSPENRFYPWDNAYVREQYKKKNFALDEREVVEYFPTEKTIEAILAIYEQFLGIRFKALTVPGLWHEDVRVIQVEDGLTEAVLGYIMVDLFPRPYKYSHAAYDNLIPSAYLTDKSFSPSLSIIIANFSKSTPAKPALLTLDQISTFFHEFGHAMHTILSRTELACQIHDPTKIDFIELPSQLFERWLDDKQVWLKISSHYKTGQHLPEQIADKLVALRLFDIGFFVVRQIFLSETSLAYFASGAHKDVDVLYTKLATEFLALYGTVNVPEARQYASFLHLGGYGASYYGYLVSRIYGYDVLEKLKKIATGHVYFDAHAGEYYRKFLLRKGASEDPAFLLKAFLEKEPTNKAFLHAIGVQ